jgi:PAS domain S-box-containing protein
MKSSGNNKRHREKKMLSMESVVQSLIQDSVALLALDKDGNIVEANMAAAKMLGYENDDLVTLRQEHVIVPSLALTDQQGSFICTAIRKNGDRFRCAVSKSRIELSPDEVATCLNIIDISKESERSAVEQIIDASEKRFRMLIERFSDAFISLDKDLNFTYVNKKAGELTKREPDSLIGKNVWVEFPDAVGKPVYFAYIEALQSQRHLRLEDYFAPLDIWIEYHFYPSPDGLSVFIQDTTENKRQQRLDQLEKEVLEFYTAKGASIQDTLTILLDGIQKIHPEMLCSVLEKKEDKLFTWASQLPVKFNQVIDGLPASPQGGVCGTAAYTKDKVVVTDVLNDPITKPFHELAHYFQLRSCWSYPIIDTSQNVLATFAIYYKTEHTLKQSEELTIERATNILRHVIENKLAQDGIKKSEEVRRLIMNSALDAIICINSDGQVTLWNPRAEMIFGWNEHEMLGKHMAEYIIPDRFRKRHEEGIRHYFKTGEGPLLNKLFEITAMNNKQQEIPIEMTILPVKQNGSEFFCAFIEDISEQKKSEALMQKMNAQLLSAQHIARLGYWELDLVNNSNYWSDEVFTICGIEKESNKASIETFARLIHPDDKKEFIESYQAAIDGVSSLRPEYRITLGDGTVRYILIEATLVRDDHGRPTRLEGTIQDITKIKENELALIELNASLNKHADELAKSNADLEQFAYIASHDLQEPLRMVTSFLTQIEKKYTDLLDEKGKQYIFFAVDGAVRMRRIILDLLEFSRVGRMDTDEEVIDMNELLREVAQLNRIIIEEKGAEITWKDLPVIRFARSPIQQVIQNLISNGLKYQPLNQRPKISIAARAVNNEWQFSVRDNGIGIDAKFFNKIFILFKRLHGKESYSGTGLGLAICKRIIENYKGRIWVESTPGKGSVFYFTIPKQF